MNNRQGLLLAWYVAAMSQIEQTFATTMRTYSRTSKVEGERACKIQGTSQMGNRWYLHLCQGYQ